LQAIVIVADQEPVSLAIEGERGVLDIQRFDCQVAILIADHKVVRTAHRFIRIGKESPLHQLTTSADDKASSARQWQVIGSDCAVLQGFSIAKHQVCIARHGGGEDWQEASALQISVSADHEFIGSINIAVVCLGSCKWELALGQDATIADKESSIAGDQFPIIREWCELDVVLLSFGIQLAHHQESIALYLIGNLDHASLQLIGQVADKQAISALRKALWGNRLGSQLSINIANYKRIIIAVDGYICRTNLLLLQVPSCIADNQCIIAAHSVQRDIGLNDTTGEIASWVAKDKARIARHIARSNRKGCLL
jgi:hypothetical protein